ncbi:MAG TPA: purine-nucleoside phosphorylase [Acidobacteriota bacterium]|nr:purine-nucleoside phosphorylase [Acidobacteriota bacterium]
MTDGKMRIDEATASIRKQTNAQPTIGIILGTGLGQLGRGIAVDTAVGYENIMHFPRSTVESHAGRLLFGQLGGKSVVAMQGRFHYYEGYSYQEITLPVRVMHQLGVKVLIVSNACGGMNPQFVAGDIMAITDHINLQTGNPLIGPNLDDFGPRFPDMYQCYDPELLRLAQEAALDLKIPLKKGVYVGVTGPNLETAAEYRFLRTIGADVVGMSTVPEVLVARHQGTRVAGFSIVTDMGLPDNLHPMDHHTIVGVANKAEPILSNLIGELVKRV